MNWRSSIFYNFSGFFGKQEKAEEETFGPDTRTKLDSKWQWLLMVRKLCKELNMKPVEVYEMNYISALNWLSLFHIENKIQAENMNSNAKNKRYN